ncbi:hypothetical protein APR50_13275 [Variovorax paradoxus]|jgi:hypothetical protein|uniref:hypothetical protein n=1 Tax=Variovorax TaxID=34072 RepID=UPI0006E72146|nr:MULTISPECIES: hypothetical protein [unclassified Variovorax]KPU92970.1 hypothetical protein APR52_26620 [Variovorax paradoxus]KPV07861.1 hypothetical protein APR50_13275 [Variovorax paradoxus]KPV09718.1 hypothetical protein APR49_12840 [Variovorax paradoxus]KPV14796.1 hypothetical protein APR51_37350 [Variovorax paradoxus]KPV26006.1 hypothetical protein APR48_32345 [Variovorax paradoxus]
MKRPRHVPPHRQRGQTILEYAIVAGILATMLFATFPGADRSVVGLLIKAFRDAWATYSYTLSFPL